MYMPGKRAADQPSTLVPALRREIQMGIPGSRLWFGPALAVAGIWGMMKQMGDMCHYTFQINLYPAITRL